MPPSSAWSVAGPGTDASVSGRCLGPPLRRSGRECKSLLAKEGGSTRAPKTPFMTEERNLAAELSLLATDVDSLAKALAQAQAELAHEREHRRQEQLQAEELRQQLRQARRRAKAAEQEVVKVGADADAAAHRAE